MKQNLILGVLLLAGIASVVRADDLVLVDGRYLHVRCLEANEARIKVLNLDTGGELWIPWSFIREEDRKRLRIAYGYEEDESAKQIFEDGVKIITTDGDEYLGVPVEPLPAQGLPELVEIMCGGRKTGFKKSIIRAVEPQQIRALDAYSGPQLYDRKLAEIKPADDDLEAHWDLARFCMAIDVYEKALLHLAKVKELDADFELERVGNCIGRMEALAKDQAVAQAIRQAKDHASYQRFAKAIADLDQILSVSTMSPVLAAQAKQTKEWVLTKRWDHFKGVVRREYFAMLTNKTGKMARDEKLKIKDVKKELRSTLHKEIMADIASKHGLDPKTEVDKMWQERTVNAPMVSSYGSGSFIVLGKAPGAQERDQQLQQAMAKAMAQQQNQGGRGGQNATMQTEPMKLPKPPTEDEWWTNFADSGTRSDWMKAFYAEQCKQLKVVGERKEDCSRCGAKGTIQFSGSQGENIAVTCPRCQGHKHDKAIAYK